MSPPANQQWLSASSRRKRAIGAVSTAVFIGVLVLLAPVGEWVSALRASSPWPLLVSVGLVMAAGVAETYRLRGLSWPTDPGLGVTLKVVFVATSIGHLPFGVVGSDVYRAGGLSAAGVPTSRAVAAVAAARGLGLAAVVAVAAAAVTWSTSTGFGAFEPDLAVPSGTVLLLLFVALAMAAVVLLLGARFASRSDRAPALLRKAAAAVVDLPGPGLVRGGAWSLLVTVLRVAVVVGCAVAVIGEPRLPSTAVAACAGMLASVIPSVMAGVGPQEAGLASVLAGLRIDPAQAVVVALAARAVTLVGALVGAILVTLSNRLRSGSAESSPGNDGTVGTCPTGRHHDLRHH